MRFEGKLWKSKTSKYWVIEVPILDVVTQGTSRDDAYVMLKDAIESLVDDKGFRVSIYPGERGEFTIGANRPQMLTAFMLRQQRARRQMTVRDVARQLHATSPNAYAQYEQGKISPSLDTLVRLLRAIDPRAEPVLKVTG